jgi:O-acetyl-ADP-ribose deacetylase (regulator of RNase III)
MITEVKGNLLEADVEALVNTVNTEGVMGKGLALQFKKAFPEMFQEYARRCAAGELRIGTVHLFRRNELLNPRYIINFPTKQSWREKTKLEYIELGLQALIQVVRDNKIQSLAIPALGSGLGGLDWRVVYPLIQQAFAALPEVYVQIYPPQDAPAPDQMIHRTQRPELTLTRAYVLRIFGAYTALGNELTVLVAQKLLYFLQEAGEPLKLRFAQYHYGPYADNLRHVLHQFEGHFIEGFADGRNNPGTVIKLRPEAEHAAIDLIEQHLQQTSPSNARLQAVIDLIEGFESIHGMELLASVHWVAHHDPSVNDADSALSAIQRWSEGKRARLSPEHVQIAWKRLAEQGWLNKAPVDILTPA